MSHTRTYDWKNIDDLLVAKNVFVVVQRLGFIDRTSSFQEFVDWMNDLEMYVQVYKPK